MSKIEDLATVFREHVGVGWPASSSGAQRIIMLVYDPNEERTLRKNIGLFAQAASAHEYREDYFSEPDMLLAGANERFAKYAAEVILQALKRPQHTEREIVGLIGVASVFGVASLSDILSRVEHAIKGRLAVFFPGRARDGRYRLLDARDSWDYHAVPIQVESSGARQ
jgi:hypothetical protein